MFNRLLVIVFSLFISISAFSQDYEVLKNGNNLLLKEPMKMVLVGSDVLAPIPLPYKNQFLLLTANGSGYSTTLVNPDFDLTGWAKTDALVFEGDFLDAHAGNEIFIQGKGITFSGGAKNAYITSSNAYVGETSHNYSLNIANASSAELTMVTQGGKAYLQLNQASMPTIKHRSGEPYYIVAQGIGSTREESDSTLVIQPKTSVTPSGALTVNYPIELPAAEGGSKPNLSISYVGSSIKNGNLGYGFTLSGVDQISVCPFNSDSPETGFKKTHLSLDKNLSQLCYNGKPLVGVHTTLGLTGLTPFANANLSSPIDGYSYDWFIVKDNPQQRFEVTNEGLTLHLIDGSKKKFQKVNDLTYAIVESETVFGNTISYDYVKTGVDVTQPILQSITWGASNQFTAQIEYSNKRNDFDVKLKSDGSGFYSNHKLITDVYIKKDGAYLNSTHMSYELIDQANRYAIKTMQSCGYIPISLCSQITNIDWEESSNLLDYNIINSSDVEIGNNLKVIGNSPDLLAHKTSRGVTGYNNQRIYSMSSTYGEVVYYSPFKRNGRDELIFLMMKLVDHDLLGEEVIGYDITNQDCGGHNDCDSNQICDYNMYIDRRDGYGRVGSGDKFCKTEIMGNRYKKTKEYTWYRVARNETDTGYLSPEKIIDAGCFDEVISNSNYNFASAGAFLSADTESDGTQDALLRVVTIGDDKQIAVGENCIRSNGGGEDDYNLSYANYSSADFNSVPYIYLTSFDRYNKSQNIPKNKYEILREDIEDIYTATRVFSKSSSLDIIQADVDGNGVLDELKVEGGASNVKSLSIEFNTPQNDNPNYAQSKTVNLGSLNLQSNYKFHDLDNDGIKELVFTKQGGSSLWYIKFNYDPVNKLFAHTENSISTGFSKGLLDFKFGDYNNDGQLDIAIYGLDWRADNVDLKVYSLARSPRISKLTYGTFSKNISYDENAFVWDNNYSSVNGIAQTRVGYSLVSGIETIFKSPKSQAETIVKKYSYEYHKHLYHEQHGYSLGFGKVIKTDELALNKITTEYYQDVEKKGLIKSVLNQSKVGYHYVNTSLLENSYKRYARNNRALGIDETVLTNYIRGNAVGSTKSIYGYDTYARPTTIETIQLSTTDVEIQKQYVENTYAYNSFNIESDYNGLLEVQDTTLSISASSPLRLANYPVGTKTIRKEFVESNHVFKTVGEVKTGYLDNAGTFIEVSSESKRIRSSAEGNPEYSDRDGHLASTSMSRDAWNYSNYDGPNPQNITHYFGASRFGNSSYRYDALGRKVYENSIEGIETSYSYDAFGRITHLDTTRDDVSYSYYDATTAFDCDFSTLPDSIANTIQGVSEARWTSGKFECTYTDAFGRSVASSWNDELDQTLFSWREFDSRGRLIKDYKACESSSCSAASPHTKYEYETNTSDLWQVSKTLADASTIIKTSPKLSNCSSITGSSNVCTTSSGNILQPLYIQETLVDGLDYSIAGLLDKDASSAKAPTHKSYQLIGLAGEVLASIEGYSSDARGVVYTRDLLGNITHVHHQSDVETTAQLVREYEYYESGLVRSDTNAVGAKEVYIYNSAGILWTDYSFGDDGRLYGSNSYHFDNYGRIQQAIESHSDEGVVATETDSGRFSYSETTFDNLRSQHYSYQASYLPEGKPADYTCSIYYPCAVWSYSAGANTKKYFNYSSDGLLTSKTEIIESDGANRNVRFNYGYSTYGDLETESISGTGLSNYQLTYTNRNKATYKLEDNKGQSLWQLTSTSSNGLPASIGILGNYETLIGTDKMGRENSRSTVDGLGNSINNWNQGFNHLGTSAYRRALITPQAENFKYDGLGQLDTTEIVGGTDYDFTVDSYANLSTLRGAILTRSDLDASCATKVANSGANPGAIPRTTSTPWMVSGHSQISGSYCYDQFGRQLINGSNAIEYFADGQAARIKNDQSEIILAYDASGVPIYEKQTSLRASKNYSAWMFDGARVEQRNDNGSETIRIYPRKNLRVTFNANNPTPVYDFVLTDTMGSVTGLARKTGDELIVDGTKLRSFTPFGSQRRLGEWNTIEDVDIGDAYGFTGQRYLSEFGLYQYVGRIYDPKLGSFTGPDPIVADESNWKAYNPYTYVLNDPLGWIDPTGYEPNIADNQQPREITQDDLEQPMITRSTSINLDVTIQSGSIDVIGSESILQGQLNTLHQSIDQGNFVTMPTLPAYSPDLGSIASIQGNVFSGFLKRLAQVVSVGVAYGDRSSTSILALRRTPQDSADIAAYKQEYPLRSAIIALPALLKKAPLNVVKTVAKGGSKALRPVGQLLESVDDVMANPQLLKGLNPGQLMSRINKSDNWVVGTMKKTRSENKGFTLREMNSRGTDFTDRYIQYHPGSRRHYNGQPYWKVSSGNGGTVRFPVTGD